MSVGGAVAALRVMHLSTVHEARDIRIFEKECRSLVEAGVQVTLFAAEPAPDRPHGVRIRCIPRRGALTRWMVSVPRAFWEALRTPADLYHLHDPELLPVGVALRVLGRRVVYDAHEDLPEDIMAKPYLPSVLRPILARVAAVGLEAVARVLSGVVAATPTVATRFGGRRTVVVRNYPRLGELEGLAGRPFRERRGGVLYLGSVSEARGLAEALAAAKVWQATHPAALTIAGPCFTPGAQALLDAARGRPGVRILPVQPRNEVRTLLGEAQVGVVALHPTPAFVASYPIKLFEYMAAGVPVVASDFPLWRTIVDGAKCGLLIDPRDHQALAAAVIWLFDHPDEAEAMGRRGAAAVRDQYRWDIEFPALIGLYQAVAGRSIPAGVTTTEGVTHFSSTG
jgi:glycosyltransferase involved in cell wall biosynthesis